MSLENQNSSDVVVQSEQLQQQEALKLQLEIQERFPPLPWVKQLSDSAKKSDLKIDGFGSSFDAKFYKSIVDDLKWSKMTKSGVLKALNDVKISNGEWSFSLKEIIANLNIADASDNVLFGLLKKWVMPCTIIRQTPSDGLPTTTYQLLLQSGWMVSKLLELYLYCSGKTNNSLWTGNLSDDKNALSAVQEWRKTDQIIAQEREKTNAQIARTQEELATAKTEVLAKVDANDTKINAKVDENDKKTMAEIAAIKVDIEVLKDDAKEANKATAELQKAMWEQKLLLEKLWKEHVWLKEMFELEQQDSDTAFASLNTEIATINEEIAWLKTTDKQYDAKLVSLKTKLKTTTEKAKGKTQQLQAKPKPDHNQNFLHDFWAFAPKTATDKIVKKEQNPELSYGSPVNLLPWTLLFTKEQWIWYKTLWWTEYYFSDIGKFVAKTVGTVEENR